MEFICGKEMSMEKTVLVVAAHPDDEVLGCGGTMSRLVHEGNNVFTLILGEGVTSRDSKRDQGKRVEELGELKTEMVEANKCLGVEKVIGLGFPDNRFDSVALLDIVKAIEKVKTELQPEIIFTHFQYDMNVDHQVTYQAVLTATRPMVGECVKEIYSFNVLSSTEWAFPQKFSPDLFVNIEDYVDKKVGAMAKYISELREFPHPRSLEGIRLSSKYWGMQVGFEFVEPFMTIRKII
jgi:LmbE family N-acetylglucosaminyl deacetylase